VNQNRTGLEAKRWETRDGACYLVVDDGVGTLYGAHDPEEESALGKPTMVALWSSRSKRMSRQGRQ
jgi:hypothetical protein